MSEGPYLYDDGPAPLHTGTPRQRNGLLLGLLGGTVAVAVGMAVALPLVKGTAEEQAREVAGVFLAALEQGDTETAFELLCEEERARLGADRFQAEYRQPGTGRVVDASEGEVDGEPVQRVEVRWEDGGTTRTSTLTVVNEDGPRVCGTAEGG
ncbi:MAG TPA: hypothetical protein VHF92_07380 [Geodermatophilus sp.]|nr:hypothetical protein [Geodermatophilus sp.]